MSEPLGDPGYNVIRNIVVPDAKKQSDRALAIVLSALVEDQLGELLRARLVDHPKIAKRMFSGLGPLATFSAKIDMSLLLGLFDEGFIRMLHAIRDTRNTFAHNMHPLTFESDEITRRLGPLSYIDELAGPSKKRSQRLRFIGACEGCLGGIAARMDQPIRLETPKRGKPIRAVRARKMSPR